MDPAAFHRQARQVILSVRHTVQTHITGQDIRVLQIIDLTVRGLQVNTIPTTRCKTIRYGVKQVIQPVRLNDHRCLFRTLGRYVSHRINRRTLVHVQSCAGVQHYVTDHHRVVDQIRFLIGEMITGKIAPSALGLNTLYVLTVSLHHDLLRVTRTQMEMQFFGDQHRVILFLGINHHAHKHKRTVPAVDLQMINLTQIRFAVHVDLEEESFHPDLIDHHGVLIPVIDHDLCGRRALLRKDRVEAQRVAREAQTQTRIVTHLILLASDQQRQDGNYHP